MWGTLLEHLCSDGPPLAAHLSDLGPDDFLQVRPQRGVERGDAGDGGAADLHQESRPQVPRVQAEGAGCGEREVGSRFPLCEIARAIPRPPGGDGDPRRGRRCQQCRQIEITHYMR